MPNEQARITELRNAIEHAQQLYYNKANTGGMADAAYDKLTQELKGLLGAKWVEEECLTRVGAPVDRATTRRVIKHRRLIGSLNNAMDKPAFSDWWPGDSVGSPKMDGLTIEATIERGELLHAVTRGDGAEGEEVTANIILAKGFKRHVAPNFTGQVRGECYLKIADFNAINDRLIADDEEPFSDPRSAACGIVRRTSGEDAEMLSFRAFDVDTVEPMATRMQKFDLLTDLGFDVVEYVLFTHVDDAADWHTNWLERRDHLDYWIDGVVFTLNNLENFATMGVSQKRPNGAIAFKFPPKGGEATVKDILLTVGHLGDITPTALFSTVMIGGAEVTNASLSNWEEIQRLDIAIGDRVRVTKRGDVIPHIEEVLDRPATRRPVPEPTKCPVCSFLAARNINTGGEMGAKTICGNPVCPAKIRGKIKRWIKSLDIKEIGDAVLDALINDKLVESPVDLYRLKDNADLQLLSINDKKLGAKRAAKIVEEIEKTTTLTIDQFIGSLGFKHLGKRRVELIRKAYSQASAATNRQPNSPVYACNLLDSIDGWFTNEKGSVLTQWADQIGIKNIAEEIQEALDLKEETILDLLRYITISAPVAAPAAPTTGPLVGKVFCFTGMRADEELAARIRTAGGIISEDLTKTCTHLVQKDTSKESSKTKKAKGWGLEIIDLDGLTALVA